MYLTTRLSCAKAGVMRLDLPPHAVWPGGCHLEPEPAGKGVDQGTLMGALALLNRRYGLDTRLGRDRKHRTLNYVGLAIKLSKYERSIEQSKCCGLATYRVQQRGTKNDVDASRSRTLGSPSHASICLGSEPFPEAVFKAPGVR